MSEKATTEEARPRGSIRSKVVAGLGAMVVLMAVLLGVLMEQQRIMDRSFLLLHRTHDVELLLLECRRQEKNFLLRRDESSVSLYRAGLDSLITAAGELAATAPAGDVARKAGRLRAAAVEYGELFEGIRAGLPEGQWLAVDLDGVDHLMQRTVAKARECHSLAGEIREDAVSRFDGANARARTVSVATIVLGLLVSILLAGWIARIAVRPMEELRLLAEKVSVGDIQDADVEFRDLDMRRFNSRESFDLARSLRRMISSLRVLVSSERGLMDDYHMTILVLVNKAVGPAGWAIIEKARAAAGFDSFPEVGPANIRGFLAKLEEEVEGLLPPDRIILLSRAIENLSS